MTAVEEIQAAIEKLTELRNLSNEGGNRREWKSTPLSPLIQADVIDSFGDVVVERAYAPDAELIVTLHRTIDAQLALLKDGVKFTTVHWGQVELRRDIGKYALALARAINGASK